MGRIERLNLDNHELQSQLSAQSVAASQLVKRDMEFQQLEAHMNQAQLRQDMMNDELVKSEAQVELIKDLFFREPKL
jgi:predicted  nucleic acid-binding Zn-ribbon protein